MAHILGDAAFVRCTDLAKVLLDEAREVAAVETIPAPGASEAMKTLLYEAEALSIAIQALAKGTALDEQSLFVAFGGAVSTILAQCQTNHRLLLKQMRVQEELTYDEVVAASQPVGRMQ